MDQQTRRPTRRRLTLMAVVVATGLAALAAGCGSGSGTPVSVGASIGPRPALTTPTGVPGIATATTVLTGSTSTVAGSAGANKAPTTSSTVPAPPPIPPPPPNCPKPTYPSPPATTPYGLAASGSLTGTTKITGTISSTYGLTPVSASLCGLLMLPNEVTSVPPQDLVFAPTATYLYVGGVFVEATVTTLQAVGNSDTFVRAVPAPNGGLDLTINTDLLVVATLPGSACQIGPFEIVLSTQNTPGTTGALPLTGRLDGASATLTANGFQVPAGVAISTGGGLPPVPTTCALVNNILLHTTGTSLTTATQTLNLGVTDK